MSALTEDDAVFFAHVPKTAGQSIRGVIGNWFDASEVLPTFVEVEDGRFSEKDLRSCRYVGSHFSYRNVLALRSLSPRHWHTITFLREPRRRTLSHLRFIQRGRNPTHPFSEQLRSLSIAEALEGASLRTEFANYQSRYLVHALAPEDTDPSHAPLVLQDQVELVGLAECVDASLLLAAYRWAMLPAAPSPTLNADPDPSAIRRSGQLIADLSGILDEMNGLDVELYAVGRDRFLRDFTAMCDELNVTRTDPLTVDASALAPLVRAVEASVLARRRVLPGPTRHALVLRVRGAAPLAFFPPDDWTGTLLRPTLLSDEPIDVLVDTGGQQISTISILAAPPHDGAHWRPQLWVDGATCEVRLTGREGYYLRCESRITSHQESRFSSIAVHLPRSDTADKLLPALVSMSVSVER
jgi:hypothetical protein